VNGKTPIKHATQTAKPDNPDHEMSADEWNEAHDVTILTGTIWAGNTYVDVAHGLSSTPSIDKIKPTPKDNLGGRSYWVSDVGAVTFRININSVDFEENHSFGIVIL
jgi:hypothetical protein